MSSVNWEWRKTIFILLNLFLSFAILPIYGISLSPSIVNPSCKLSKSTILLKKKFEFNSQVPTSTFKLNIRWCKSWVPIKFD
nr:hypothetical protein CFP56_24842 [Quercus suber]